MPMIDTEEFSARLRERIIRPRAGQLLIARIKGSEQEGDLTDPPNCEGYGRIRHFRLHTTAPWPPNSLPIIPASHRLGFPPAEMMTAQVFQNAACNWRCWYCFMPFDLLSGSADNAGWLSANDMVKLYLREHERPVIIDCSGGQPDLVPEWVPWMMRSLRAYGMADSVYLWSDDNLSNDYFWRYLEPVDHELIASWELYGRVCCFKGFNASSFSFNTKAAPELFNRQFELFERLLGLGIDIYAYATFTTPDDTGLARDMSIFVDRLQAIHPNLPLRLVPLRIDEFGVVVPRVREEHRRAMSVQHEAVQVWHAELAARFSESECQTPISAVPLGR